MTFIAKYFVLPARSAMPETKMLAPFGHNSATPAQIEDAEQAPFALQCTGKYFENIDVGVTPNHLPSACHAPQQPC